MDIEDSAAQADRTALAQSGNRNVSEPVRLIAEQLYSQIAAGKHKYRLPPERQLAEQFDVPRNTIRGALELLEMRKVINRRAGSGNFIQEPAMGFKANGEALPSHNVAVAENTGPHKLQTVRDIFEPELVRLAVIHTSPKNIDALGKIVEKMGLIDADAKAFVECEENFCIQLAQGTENPLLIAIYELITDVRRLSNWKVQRQKKLSPARIRDCQERYRLMYRAIENRNADRAVEILKSQLIDEHEGPASEV